jgi:hypothetical protein
VKLQTAAEARPLCEGTLCGQAKASEECSKHKRKKRVWYWAVWRTAWTLALACMPHMVCDHKPCLSAWRARVAAHLPLCAGI